MNKDYISGVLEELGDRSGYAAINGFVEEAEFYSRVIRLIRELNQENEKVEVKKYREKPVVVEAHQTQKEMIIHTLEGDMKAGKIKQYGVHPKGWSPELEEKIKRRSKNE